LADPESITIAVDHLTEDFLHENRSFCWNWRSAVVGAGNFGGISYLVQIRNRLIHCFEVLAHNGFTLATVCLLNGVFNLCQGFFGRQNTADREEASLHDSVDAAAHASGFSHLIGIDHIKFELLFDNILLHLARQGIPDFVGTVDGIQQEDVDPGRELLEHIK